MRISATDEFKRRYNRLPEEVKDKLEKQLVLMRENMKHPSLRTEKLAPKARNVWSFRIDLQYRVGFRFQDNGDVILLTVGTHDWVYRRV
jgi:mRNA-degrading endonuclease RelE of RelBE toxin-antitoxin system